MNSIFKYIFMVFLFLSVIHAKNLSEKSVNIFLNSWLKVNQSFLHYGKYKNENIEFKLKSLTPVKDSANNTLFFVGNITPAGFVLIAPDDRLQPIIGYSSEHDFNFNNYKDDYFLAAIADDLQNRIVEMDGKNIQKMNIGWDVNELKKSVKNIKEIIGPFLDSDWGQGYVRGNPVYNYYSPNHWPTGCVATASAQILNYFKWPYQGYGTHGYYDNGKYLYADFGHTFYDWANVLDKYEDTYFTTDNQKAAGELVYHCAVALEMDFEYNGSTASTSDVPGILHNYFRYSGHYESVGSSGFWTEMKNNMLDERPAIISIKSTSHSVGHAAVVDGYFDTNGFYHVNPGWYGDYTGWYNISGDWQMETYNIVTGATKGIVPSPQINELERLTENSFLVSWRTSRYQKAEYYQLQQARSSSGPWITLADNIVDTLYEITNADQGSYYYKIRAFRNNIWWDYSKIKKIQLGSERSVTFQVDMTYQPLSLSDTLVIRGNIPPLAGNVNSIPMEKIDTTNIYKLTLNFDYDYVGQTIIYRFFIQSKNSLVAEQQNREYTLTSAPSQILAPVYFNDLVNVDDESGVNNIQYGLEQNYPNPFNPTTEIRYSVGDNNQRVLLKVYDILGKEIATLVNDIMAKGNYSVNFSPKNIPSGVYFYRLIAGNKIITKKMIIVK